MLPLMETINTPNSVKSVSAPAKAKPEPRYSLLSAAAKARRLMACLHDQKAKDIVGLDIAGKSACMDAIIVATANSARHARSLADSLSELAGKENFEWLRMEGYQNGEWVLADLNDVVVHIFQQEMRGLFHIEALWKDAAELSKDENDSEKDAAEKAAAEKVSPCPGVTPTLLLILDGYGLAPASEGNAATLADTPNIDALLQLPGTTQLAASGLEVGLPRGYMGNSEVGHLNIGAGRVVYQEMTRIDLSLESGEFEKLPPLTELFSKVRIAGGKLHLMTLLSDGGVHSHIHHLEAVLRMAAKAGVQAVVHAFMDGRDTPPASGAEYVRRLERTLAETGAQLGSIIGRFYAMDRDKRWDRVNVAWDMLVHAQGEQAENGPAALEASYAAGVTDEFVKPLILADNTRVQNGDGIFFLNFRADRARELVSAFCGKHFEGFKRGRVPALSGVLTLTAYDSTLDVPTLFAKDDLSRTLGEVAANLGYRQLRIAETEKYAHVTYFFSGGREDAFPGEERILVNSPKDVATYDMKPQMSVFEVTERLLDVMHTDRFMLTVCNLANPDMVGHTGKIPAAIAALESVDACVGRIVEAVDTLGWRMLVTADHGNVEMMVDPETGSPHTAHTCNPVPLLAYEKGKAYALKPGKIGDIAPTILALWGVPKPKEMDGESLLLPGVCSGASSEAGAGAKE